MENQSGGLGRAKTTTKPLKEPKLEKTKTERAPKLSKMDSAKHQPSTALNSSIISSKNETASKYIDRKQEENGENFRAFQRVPTQVKFQNYLEKFIEDIVPFPISFCQSELKKFE